MVAGVFEIVRVDFGMLPQTDATEKYSVAVVAFVLNVLVTIFMVLQMILRSERLRIQNKFRFL